VGGTGYAYNDSGALADDGLFKYYCDGENRLLDVNDAPVASFTYDVFGRPTIRDANGAEIGETAVGNAYLFTGRRYDAEARDDTVEVAGRFYFVSLDSGLHRFCCVGGRAVGLPFRVSKKSAFIASWSISRMM
jgi:hypothetical protein